MIGSIGSSTALSQMASTLFSKLDSKNQGYVEQSDMESAFSALGSSSSSTSVEDIFSTLDGDGDGKITESEFSSSLQNLVDELESQLKSSQAGGMSGRPPPPPPPEGDEGFTQEELSALSEEVAATDSSLSSLMASIAADFETADSDGNGKVNQEEAMAYQSQYLSSSGAETSSGSSTSTETASESNSAEVLQQILQLLRAYGQSDEDETSTLFAQA